MVSCDRVEYPLVLWYSGKGPSWRHPMETFSALLALCEGNSPTTTHLSYSHTAPHPQGHNTFIEVSRQFCGNEYFKSLLYPLVLHSFPKELVPWSWPCQNDNLACWIVFWGIKERNAYRWGRLARQPHQYGVCCILLPSFGSAKCSHESDRRCSGGRFKNTYELLNLRALKSSPVNKINIFQCMGMIFCVEF